MQKYLYVLTLYFTTPEKILFYETSFGESSRNKLNPFLVNPESFFNFNLDHDHRIYFSGQDQVVRLFQNQFEPLVFGNMSLIWH